MAKVPCHDSISNLGRKSSGSRRGPRDGAGPLKSCSAKSVLPGRKQSYFLWHLALYVHVSYKGAFHQKNFSPAWPFRRCQNRRNCFKTIKSPHCKVISVIFFPSFLSSFTYYKFCYLIISTFGVFGALKTRLP